MIVVIMCVVMVVEYIGVARSVQKPMGMNVKNGRIKRGTCMKTVVNIAEKKILQTHNY
jgi:hypothetical protein